MKRFVYCVIIAVFALFICFVVGWIKSSHVNETRLDSVVAMSWGDGKYGAGFYGAHVYLDPVDTGFLVRARVYIGRGNDFFHDCGWIGTASTDAEAVAKWGRIEWREDGLHIGSGPNEYFLPRVKLESHR